MSSAQMDALDSENNEFLQTVVSLVWKYKATYLIQISPEARLRSLIAVFKSCSRHGLTIKMVSADLQSLCPFQFVESMAATNCVVIYTCIDVMWFLIGDSNGIGTEKLELLNSNR